MPGNRRLAILAHEVAHALGITYRDHPRHEAEVIVETAAVVALAAAGLDTSGESVPYVAAWSERDTEAIERTAAIVDQVAAQLEAALGLDVQKVHQEQTEEPEGLDPTTQDPDATRSAAALPTRRPTPVEGCTRLHTLCGRDHRSRPPPTTLDFGRNHGDFWSLRGRLCPPLAVSA